MQLGSSNQDAATQKWAGLIQLSELDSFVKEFRRDGCGTTNLHSHKLDGIGMAVDGGNSCDSILICSNHKLNIFILKVLTYYSKFFMIEFYFSFQIQPILWKSICIVGNSLIFIMHFYDGDKIKLQYEFLQEIIIKKVLLLISHYFHLVCFSSSFIQNYFWKRNYLQGLTMKKIYILSDLSFFFC